MILRAEGITKRFGGLCALDQVSFAVKEGAILGLIGPNGAGKTTLFNCINGTLPVNEGQLYFRQKKITGIKAYEAARLGICRSYQVVKPFRNMTVLENAMVGAFCKTKSRKEAERIAAESLETTGLGGKMDAPASTLNLGQSKKLEVAKSLATKPELLLLDEVMAGLLPAEVQEMSRIIKDINKSGVTIILIEHIMEAVMALSDQIIVLDFGKKIAEGTAQEIIENPAVIEAYLGKGGELYA